jgi:hypothetical protein
MIVLTIPPRRAILAAVNTIRGARYTGLRGGQSALDPLNLIRVMPAEGETSSTPAHPLLPARRFFIHV